MLGIHFKKLFGRFDYDVTFNAEGLTILTGPNGFGKSTILKSIEALGKEFEGIIFFMRLDFEQIIIDFTDEKKLVINKVDNDLKINGTLISGERIKKYIERDTYLSKINEDTWIDRRRIRVNLSDYINDFLSDDSYDKEINLKEIQTLLKEIKKLVNSKIYLIKEQRLIRENKNRFKEQEVINIIEDLPRRFKELVQKVQQNYSITANGLDSTYPNRLFSTEEGITEFDYKIKIEEMSSKFEALNKYDLSNMQNFKNVIFRKEHAKALKIYFEDFEIKYKVYEDFVKKLDLFTDIINQRFTFKKIKISKEFGIGIVDEKNKKLKLSQLSSGEKQEIILFYDLIFGTQKDILLLIDEPEISLHIVWQKKFMDDLLKIIKYKGFNVIVATHSPQIINNHWDKQIDLGELYGKQLNKRKFK